MGWGPSNVTDGRHRRVGKRVDGVMVRQWLYEDQLNPVAELDGSGNLLFSYVYASREHSPDFVVNAAGDVYRVLSDQLGSPRLVVNVADDTDVLLEAEYSAFGERTASVDAAGLTLGFAGGVFDADTGLTRFGARDYDAQVGRWTAKDPIGFDGGQANLFAYVGNDPANFVDPSGRIAWALPLVCIGGGCEAVIAGAAALFATAACVLSGACEDAAEATAEAINDACEWFSKKQDEREGDGTRGLTIEEIIEKFKDKLTPGELRKLITQVQKLRGQRNKQKRGSQ